MGNHSCVYIKHVESTMRSYSGQMKSASEIYTDGLAIFSYCNVDPIVL